MAELLYENGALPDDLARVVDLVTVKSYLNQSTQAALVRNMYPVGAVSDDTVLKVVGSLGQGQRKPLTTVQLFLLKWLIMVYHLLESTDVLSQCYSILFNLLDERDLRCVRDLQVPNAVSTNTDQTSTLSAFGPSNPSETCTATSGTDNVNTPEL